VKNGKNWDAAGRGNSAVRAALTKLLLDELSHHEGGSRCTLAWDLGKFYDSISIPKLAEAGIAYHYPGVQLLLGVRCYTGPRMLVWLGAVNQWIIPDTSIAAGCVQANRMARMVVCAMLEKTHDMSPTTYITQFVGDCNMSEEGSEAEIPKKIPAVAKQVALQRKDQKLKMNSSKSAVNPDSTSLANSIKNKIFEDTGLDLKIAKEVKCLGIDKAAGRRRAIGSAQKRFKAAASRVLEAKTLRRARKVGVGIFATAAKPQIAYNEAGQGTTPTELARLRTVAASACQTNSNGSCAATFINITCGEFKDPAFILMAAQVKEWLHVWVRKNQQQRKRIARPWAAAKAHLGQIAERNRWRHVKGPMGALILSLQRVGWNVKGLAVWEDPRKGLWMCNSDTLDLEEFLREIHGDVMQNLRLKANKHEQGNGVGEGVELRGAKRHIHSLRKRGRCEEVGCLKGIVCGTYWTRRRKKMGGFHVDDVRPRCGQEPETASRRFWRCEHNETLKEKRVPDANRNDGDM
jgi:hypothetical protein